MLPVLLSIGKFKLYSYGVFLFIGLFLGLFWWWRLGRDEHIDEGRLFDTGFILMFVYFFMSRFGHVVWKWRDLRSLGRGLAIFIYPGMVNWVGVISVIITLIIISRMRGWKVWKILDIFSVTLSLVMLFVGIGGILNGSNPGRDVSVWGVIYPGYEGKAFPIDALNIIWFLFTFGVVSRVRKNFRFYRWFKGDQSNVNDGLAALVFLLFISIYCFVRSFLENPELTILGSSTMFWIGIIGFVFSLMMIYIRSGRALKQDWSLLTKRFVGTDRKKRKL